MYKDHETPRFWLSYSEALRSYLLKRMKNTEAVEDVLHDVYLKIFCHCKRFDFSCEKAGVKNLRSWVFQVCHNAMVDYYKTRSRYKLTGDAIEVSDDLVVCEEKNLMTLLKSLPEKYSVPVYYDVVLQMNQADIAERIGMGLPATKSRIQRGKQMLLRQYQSKQ
jgi:RNA polymerase sigma-70 factor (ECF subfamily)